MTHNFFAGPIICCNFLSRLKSFAETQNFLSRPITFFQGPITFFSRPITFCSKTHNFFVQTHFHLIQSKMFKDPYLFSIFFCVQSHNNYCPICFLYIHSSFLRAQYLCVQTHNLFSKTHIFSIPIMFLFRPVIFVQGSITVLSRPISLFQDP